MQKSKGGNIGKGWRCWAKERKRENSWTMTTVRWFWGWKKMDGGRRGDIGDRRWWEYKRVSMKKRNLCLHWISFLRTIRKRNGSSARYFQSNDQNREMWYWNKTVHWVRCPHILWWNKDMNFPWERCQWNKTLRLTVWPVNTHSSKWTQEKGTLTAVCFEF